MSPCPESGDERCRRRRHKTGSRVWSGHGRISYPTNSLLLVGTPLLVLALLRLLCRAVLGVRGDLETAPGGCGYAIPTKIGAARGVPLPSNSPDQAVNLSSGGKG